MAIADGGYVSRRLRSFIAPGAPATRMPCDGAESELRIEFGFTPAWFREHCGVDFSERWHLDPLYRGETVGAMRRELLRRFPSLPFGGSAYATPAANLDGVHGAVLVARIFGVDAEYYPDNWPAARHAFLSKEALSHLEVPELSSVPVMVQLFAQMDAIERAYGQVCGYLNWQGVLNNAQRLRGPELFSDLLEDPPFARHVFEVVARTMIAGMRLVYERQRQTGVVVRHATVSNCLVNMVSGDVYREYLLPFDRMIRDAFDYFGVHNCAWNADPYMAHYAEITGLGYVDMGIESDLQRARELFPDARRAIMFTPKDLANQSLEGIRRGLERIWRTFSPCDVVMADIDRDVPDERVMAFAREAESVVRTVAR